jgi:hypothetical protein
MADASAAAPPQSASAALDETRRGAARRGTARAAHGGGAPQALPLRRQAARSASLGERDAATREATASFARGCCLPGWRAC